MPTYDASITSPTYPSTYKDPYYLAPGDHPSLQIVTTRFSGKHYLNWCRSVKLVLIAKNKLDFITGKLPKPKETDEKYHDWIRADYTVLSWLINAVSSEIAAFMLYSTSSKNLWDELKERYNMLNAPYLYQLRRNMAHTEQNGMSVAEYYGRLKSIWEDMNSLDPLPECECQAINSCSCNLLKKIVDRDNRNKVLDFLMGLDVDYKVVREQILATDPLPSVGQVFFKVQQAEMHKLNESGDIHKGDTMACAAQRGYTQRTGYTNQSSHYLGENSGVNKQSYQHNDNTKSRPILEFFYCHKKGHTKPFCYKLKADTERARLGGRFAGNVDSGSVYVANTDDTPKFVEETPFDGEKMAEPVEKQVVDLDPALVNVVYHNVFAAVKQGLNPMEFITGQNPTTHIGMHLAGPYQ